MGLDWGVCCAVGSFFVLFSPVTVTEVWVGRGSVLRARARASNQDSFTRILFLPAVRTTRRTSAPSGWPRRGRLPAVTALGNTPRARAPKPGSRSAGVGSRGGTDDRLRVVGVARAVYGECSGVRAHSMGLFTCHHVLGQTIDMRDCHEERTEARWWAKDRPQEENDKNGRSKGN